MKTDHLNYSFGIILLLNLVLCLVAGERDLWAQETSRTRVQNKADLLRAWALEQQPSGVRIKGSGLKGIERVSDDDIAQVADNYEKLTELPTAEMLVHFAYDSDEIHPDSEPLLKSCVEVLQDYPDIKVVIAGHTDSIGSRRYNLGLSQRRAESVKRYLMQHSSIDPSRFYVRAFGETQPIETNDTERGRAQNRRVEFIRYQ